MYPMFPVLKAYAWGSRHRLRQLVRDVADVPSGPIAEMWFSGHPRWPSRLQLDPDGVDTDLSTAIRMMPEYMLGTGNSEEYGPVLPYLLKIISVHTPLSLQVHPVGFQARAGFNEQNAEGIAFDAPERSYRDPVEKREMLVALEPFAACVGIAPIRTMIANLKAVDHPVAHKMLEALVSGGHEPTAADPLMPQAAISWPVSQRRVFRALRSAVTAYGDPAGAAPRREPRRSAQMPGNVRPAADGLLLSLHDALDHVLDGSSGGVSRLAVEYAIRAAETFTGDASVLALLLMNPLKLDEGDSVFIPAGTLHAYIQGTAVEIMSNSDNVLRAGMTVKHRDIAHFLASVSCRPDAPLMVRTTSTTGSGSTRVLAYDPPEGEFKVFYGHVGTGDGGNGSACVVEGSAPRIAVCTKGCVVCSTPRDRRRLQVGQAVFIPAQEGTLRITADSLQLGGRDPSADAAVAVAATR